MRRHVRTESRQITLARLVGDLSIDDSDRAIDRVDAQAKVRRLATALERLTDADRDVLLLTALGDLNATEVAAVLDIPAGTVRSRLHRVRRQLMEDPNARSE